MKRQRSLAQLQLRIEAADAEPDPCCFDSVDDPTLLSDEALAQKMTSSTAIQVKSSKHKI